MTVRSALLEFLQIIGDFRRPYRNIQLGFFLFTGFGLSLLGTWFGKPSGRQLLRQPWQIPLQETLHPLLKAGLRLQQDMRR